MEGSLFRDRDFRLVAGSVGLSAAGDWVAIVALGLFVGEQTDAGWLVAALWICLFGPSILVSGFAGLLVDRIETTRLLAMVSAAGAVVAGVLAFTSTIPLALGLTALLGVVFAVSQPAEFALVPPLAGDRVQEANGHVETARYVGFGVGPLVGGLLFALGGLELAMLVDAATFVAVAAAARSLRIKRPPDELGEGEAAPRARDGIACLYRDSSLALVMTVAFGSLFFMSAVWVGELFFVEDALGMGDVAYASMFSVWTAGMALGAMLLSRRVAVTALAIAGLAAATVQGASLALPALWLSFTFYLACAFVGGTAHGVKNVTYRSLIHTRVPESLHGRAFAAYNAIRNTAEIGAFAAGGFLVTAIGARGTLAYAGGLSALVGFVGLLALLRLKESEPETEIASVPPN
ncbi:MAG TPA: MFS transporter [Solirubrobacterales bacterium]|nr:MFS transporter [Solirubrobacterales bacterium]